MLTKETATTQAKWAFRVAEKVGRWPAEEVPTERAIEAVVENLFVKPGDLEGFLFHWSTKHGQCYDCGLPAAFLRCEVPTKEADRPENRVCAICAANAAADGEIISRISS